MRKSVLIVAAFVALACASTALAGGWATVKLSSSPKGMTADEPWVVNITVLQHGLASQPLCCLKPTVTIRRVGSVRSVSALGKKSLTFRARPTSRSGVYRAKIVFPSAGIWRYEVFDAFTEYGGARTHTFRSGEDLGLEQYLASRRAEASRRALSRSCDPPPLAAAASGMCAERDSRERIPLLRENAVPGAGLEPARPLRDTRF